MTAGNNAETPKNAITIGFVHSKGGTGKTTSCLNLAGWLVKLNKKVLVIDLDPQANATTGLGIDREKGHHRHDGRSSFNSWVVATTLAGA
jgi:cellulose biosynthesis protein BcsQ